MRHRQERRGGNIGWAYRLVPDGCAELRCQCLSATVLMNGDDRRCGERAGDRVIVVVSGLRDRIY